MLLECANWIIPKPNWVHSALSVCQASLSEKDGALTRVKLELQKAQVKKYLVHLSTYEGNRLVFIRISQEPRKPSCGFHRLRMHRLVLYQDCKTHQHFIAIYHVVISIEWLQFICPLGYPNRKRWCPNPGYLGASECTGETVDFFRLSISLVNPLWFFRISRGLKKPSCGVHR